MGPSGPETGSAADRADEMRERLSRTAQLTEKVKDLVREIRPANGGEPDAFVQETCRPVSSAVAPHMGSGAPIQIVPNGPEDGDELSLQIFVARENINRLAALAESPRHDPGQISRLLNREILRLCALLYRGEGPALPPAEPTSPEPPGQDNL